MLPQFLNQYLLLALPVLLLAAAAVWLLVKRWSWKWWLPWGGTLALLIGLFFAFRSPPATVTEVRPVANVDQDKMIDVAALAELTPIFATADAIRDYITNSGGKPTLVEFRSDFGIR